MSLPAYDALLYILVFSLVFSCCSLKFSTGAQPYRDEPGWGKLRRDDCTTNSNWQATKAAWIADDTDTSLASWWQNVSSRTHQSFVTELGENFGTHLNGYDCGIGSYSSCITPACSDYQGHGDPAWAYQALLSVVNLNTFFNALYTGVTNGQADFSDLTGDLAARFFPWKNPTFPLGDAAFWIVALLTALFAIPAGMEIAAEGIVIAAGAGAFLSAGVQEVTLSLQPSPISSQLTLTQGLAQLNVFAEQAGSATRASIEQWSNATFAGSKDVQGKSILDYLANGTFTKGTIPSFTQIEQFYKAQMVSRTINQQWATQKIFLTFHRTDDPNDASGPNSTRYYSAEDGGVYYLYKYEEDGVLLGHLDKPYGLDYLNGSTYGISGNQITKAAARAYRAGKFNYTQDMAQNRIVESMTSNSTMTPFADGAGWEGTWTLPVCDMGDHNWNTQYGNTSSRYGMLPCCCGPNCNETSLFIKHANMVGFQTLLRGCNHQLQGSGINYTDVDYGFSWQHSFPLIWAELSMGQKAGVAIGIISVSISLLIFSSLLCCFMC